eukprot:TRINITY_DN3736_c0_g1_i1.p1 TRINITY_DN3736_c0_g1~~TRINITY_DN3736_c0_g1_i1.p1  ORF type:complete len:456 (+),score=41.84 TRINITY_DN3736_c0_g1_i1:276-1643(+)
MPIALWAYPTLSLATASAFSLSDLIAQSLELRYTANKKKPAGYVAETSEDEQGNPSGISGARVLFFGSLGALAGLSAAPVVHMASNLLPAQTALSTIFKSLLIEVIYPPAMCAGVLGATAFFHHKGSWDAVWAKLKSDFIPTILPHVVLAPAWSLLFLDAVPVPGFKFGLPGAVAIIALHVPYLVFASYRSARDEALPLEFTMLPFTWADLFCKETALCLAICLGCAYINCVSQVLTDYIGTTGAMWDPGFQLLPFIPSVWIIDMFVTGQLALMLGHMITKHHPPFPVLLRRVLLIHGATILLRGATLLIGAPFLPNPELTCEMVHPWSLPVSAFMVLVGMGHTCHDLFFSGHAACIMLPTLYIHRYSKSTAFKVVSWTLATTGLTSIVATHAHYTIDVIGGMAASTLLWQTYHYILTKPPREGFLACLSGIMRDLEHDTRLLGSVGESAEEKDA